MAAINFPNNPQTNDTHTVGSLNYVYDGAKWVGGGNSPVDKIYEDDSKAEIVDAGGSSGYFIVSPEGTEAFRVNSTGKLLFNNFPVTSSIGGQSSAGTLKIYGGATNQGGQIDLLGGNTEDGIIKFRTGASAGEQTEKVRITANGYVSIGEPTASFITRRLYVAGSETDAYSSTDDSNNAYLRLINKNGTDNTGVNNHVGIEMYVATGATTIGMLSMVRTGNNIGDFTYKTRTGANTYAEHFRITSAGNLLLNHDSSDGSGKLQVFTNSQDGIDIFGFSSGATGGGRLTFYRSKSTGVGNFSEVANGDSLGRIDWRGYNDDGTANNLGATIEALVSGDVDSTTDMPSDLVFKTSPNGGASPIERLRISSNGILQLDNGNQITAADTTTYIGLGGGNSTSNGANMFLYGGSHSSNASSFIFRTNTTERLRILSTGAIRIGGQTDPIDIVKQSSNNGTLSFEGSAGQLFSITNNLTSGSLFSVNDVSGLPSIDVDAGGDILIAPYSGNVGVGVTSNPAYKLEVNGSFAAITKSFVINHPTKPGMKLRYGSLEGPENGVYIRGKTSEFIVELPDYWTGLIDEDTITVNLTPIGKTQTLWVQSIEDNKVTIGSKCTEVEYFYTIYGERKDVEKLEVEIS